MTKRNTTPLPTAGLVGVIMGQSYLLLIFAQLSWAGNIVSGKLAVGEIDPYVLSMVRWGIALLIAIPFCWPYARRDWARIKANWHWLALYGGFGFATFNILMYGATHFTTAVNASMEQALIPILVMVGNFVIFKVRANALQIVGVVMTIFGVAYTATNGDLARILSLDVNIGDGMVILACLCYATYSLTLRFKPDIHWMSFILVTMFFAFFMSTVYQLVLGGGPVAAIEGIGATTWRGWMIVAYVAIFPSIVAQLFYARGVELIGPNRASLFINLLPVFGAILSVIVVGETLQGFHLIAAIFIIGGIILAEFAARRQLRQRSLKPPA